jgi:serine protease inhibitor
MLIAELTSAADANNEFALAVYSQLRRGKNIFCSPFSIRTALAMVHAAARSTAHMNDVVVQLFLPKFRISWGTVDLSEHLKQLGMRLLFDPERCDLSGINGHRPPSDKAMFVSRVLHKAFVEFYERGAEAAAATAVTVREGGRRTELPRSSALSPKTRDWPARWRSFAPGFRQPRSPRRRSAH